MSSSSPGWYSQDAQQQLSAARCAVAEDAPRAADEYAETQHDSDTQPDMAVGQVSWLRAGNWEEDNGEQLAIQVIWGTVWPNSSIGKN